MIGGAGERAVMAMNIPKTKNHGVRRPADRQRNSNSRITYRKCLKVRISRKSTAMGQQLLGRNKILQARVTRNYSGNYQRKETKTVRPSTHDEQCSLVKTHRIF